MLTVNIHEAKTQLSKLIERAANGEPFIIAKAGKPRVKVVAIDIDTSIKPRRLGFLKGQFQIPDDFDQIGAAEIERQFAGQ
jgi:prevent-host-death family protein